MTDAVAPAALRVEKTAVGALSCMDAHPAFSLRYTDRWP